MLVRFDQVSKSFNSKLLLTEVCFQLNFAEKVGLIGKNGCGKTTFLRLINGELEPDNGHVIKHSHLENRVLAADRSVRFGEEPVLMRPSRFSARLKNWDRRSKVWSRKLKSKQNNPACSLCWISTPNFRLAGKWRVGILIGLRLSLCYLAWV